MAHLCEAAMAAATWPMVRAISRFLGSGEPNLWAGQGQGGPPVGEAAGVTGEGPGDGRLHLPGLQEGHRHLLPALVGLHGVELLLLPGQGDHQAPLPVQVLPSGRQQEAKVQVSRVEYCNKSGVRYQVSGIAYQVSGIRYQAVMSAGSS